MRSPSTVLSVFDEMVAILRQLPFFNSLDDRQLEALAEEARLVVLLKGRVLFHVGESPRHFYFLGSGCIQLETEGTESKVLGIISPGEGLCEATTILGMAYRVSAQATTESKLVAIPRSYMMRLLEDGGVLTHQILELLSKQLLDAQQQMLEMNGHSGVRRVACYLLHFSPRLDSSSFEMTLPISKQAVASHLNMTKESFSRALREMREAGILEVNGRTISVLDSERLRHLR